MKKTHIYLLILFSLIYSLIFLKYFFVSWIPVWNDWAFPIYWYQLKNWFVYSLYLWQDHIWNIFWSRLSFSLALFFQYIWKIFYELFNMKWEQYQKILFFLSFLIWWYSSYYLFYKYSKNHFMSFLWWLVFTLNPVSFNFILMWWNFAFISIFSFPLIILLFEKNLENNELKYLFILSILFSIFWFVESQSIVHFMFLLTIYYFIKKWISKVSIFDYIRKILIILWIVILLHSYWLIWVFLIKDPYIASSVIQDDITRFALRFSYVDLIRGWGSVFNYQFETAYPYILSIFSFFPLAIFLYSIFIRRYNTTDIFFFFVFLYPFLMYLFSKYFSFYIPYTAVIRDFWRSFPYLFLSSGYFLSKINLKNKWIYCWIVISFLFFIFPFIDGSLFNIRWNKATWISEKDYDQRLRLLKFDSNIANIDFLISKEYFNKKSLYFPLWGWYIFPWDKRFDWLWASIRDYSVLFSNNIKSPMYNGLTQWAMKNFFEHYYSYISSDCKNKTIYFELLNSSWIKYIVLRKWVLSTLFNLSSDDVKRCLIEPNFSLVKEYENYYLYKYNNYTKFSRIYINK